MNPASPKYRSKLEEKMAAFLNKRKIKFKYEDGKIPYYVNVRGGKCGACGSVKGILKKRYYVPDFKVGAIVLETKGRLTSAERTKFIAITEVYPSLVLVFQRDNAIRKGRTTTYSEWANENGILNHVGTDLPPKLVAKLKAEAKRVANETKDPTP